MPSPVLRPPGPALQDVPEQRSMEYPKLYEPGQLNLLFNKREFFICIAQGIYASVLVFFLPYGVFAEAARDDGAQLADYQSFAVTVATSLVIVVSVQVGGGDPGPAPAPTWGLALGGEGPGGMLRLPVTAACRRSGWTRATGRPSTTSSSGAAWRSTSPFSSPCTAMGSSACSRTSSGSWVSPQGCCRSPGGGGQLFQTNGASVQLLCARRSARRLRRRPGPQRA